MGKTIKEKRYSTEDILRIGAVENGKLVYEVKREYDLIVVVAANLSRLSCILPLTC
jgi:hypothetical protein